MKPRRGGGQERGGGGRGERARLWVRGLTGDVGKTWGEPAGGENSYQTHSMWPAPPLTWVPDPDRHWGPRRTSRGGLCTCGHVKFVTQT